MLMQMQESAVRGRTREMERRRRTKEEENYTTDSVKTYFLAIKKIKLLKADEEKDLAKRIAKGDKEALKNMIEANLRLVVNIAKRYLNRGLPLQDLIEEGNIGLMKSAERFRASKGCKFSTYATYWIKQAIERAIANQSNIVRLPIHVVADISKCKRAAKKLRSEHKEVTAGGIADLTGMTGRYVKKMLAINTGAYTPLDDPHPSWKDDDMSFLETIECPDTANAMDIIFSREREEKVKKLLDALKDETDRKIIMRRFGFDGHEPETLEQIGGSLGITRERVRQIEVRALANLKMIAHRDGSFEELQMTA